MKKLAALLMFGLILASCSSDDEAAQPVPTATAKIIVQPMFDNQPFSFNSQYSVNGIMLKFDRVSFYIDSLALVDASGNVVANSLSPGQLLFNGDQSQTYDTNIPVSASYVGLEMHLGINSIANAADPVIAPFPLDQPGMHWGWNPMAGYKFAVFEGQYDSNGDGALSAIDLYFVYHCATNPLYTAVQTSLTAGSGQEIKLKLHIDQLFSGVNIPNVNSQHGGGSTNVQIMQNFQNAFEASL